MFQNSDSVLVFIGEQQRKERSYRLGCSEEDRAKVWKEHVQKMTNDANEWDQIGETDDVVGPVEKVTRREIVEAMQ